MKIIQVLFVLKFERQQALNLKHIYRKMQIKLILLLLELRF